MKQILRILVVMSIFSSCNGSLKKLSEKEFTKVYLKELKVVFPDAEYKIIDNLIITVSYLEMENKQFLDNAYIEYKMQPDSIKAIIIRHINSHAEFYKNKETINLERIVPTIKSADYIEKVAQSNGINANDLSLVYEKYNDQLIILYAEDTDNSISYFSPTSFNALGIDKEGLLQQAVNNIKELISEVNRSGENGTYMITAGGDYENSLILWEELWTKENFNVNGDFIIAIPNRDILFVTGSNDKAGIDLLKKNTAQSYREGTYPVSPYLFKWNGTKFEKYD